MMRSRGGRVMCAAMLAAAALHVPAVHASVDPDDPLYGEQTNLHEMRVSEAWETATGEGTTVAIFDFAGVDALHEDLAGQVREESSDIAAGRHPTAMAGIVAAAMRNGTGIAGVSPGSSILSMEYEESGEGVRMALDLGADVLVFAVATWFPGPTPLVWDATGATQVADDVVGYEDVYERTTGYPYDPFRDAIAEAWARGAVIVAAAGNDAAPLCSYPAAYPHVLCVGASSDGEVDRVDGRPFPVDLVEGRADYSNWGFRVDVLAPGNVPWTTTYGSTCAPSGCTEHRGYGDFIGTSAAAPNAAGVAALLLSAGATNEEAVALLKCTAQDLGPAGADLEYGHGRIDAAAAAGALGTGIACEDPPRTVLDLATSPAAAR